MLKEMLFALDLALHVGTPADKKAADRLQRRSTMACHHTMCCIIIMLLLQLRRVLA